MKLDYQILHVINNYKVDGRAKYDYVKSTVWFRSQELCDMIKNEFGLDIIPETRTDVTRETANAIWRRLSMMGNICGVYGDDFLNEWTY